MLFDGFFKKGKKQNITPVKEMGGNYWKELDVNGEIARISQLDDLGNYEGLCYIFNCGVTSRISKWKEGKEVSLLKQFNGDIMTVYNNGLKVYEGGFLNSLELYFPRNGKGVEFGKDGKTKIFEGTYKCGKLHGRGAKYNNGLAGKRKRWIIGHTSTGFWCLQLLYLILILFIIIGFRIDPIVSVILLSLFMILWLILWKCCGKANIRKRNINDIDYIAANICQSHLQDESDTKHNKATFMQCCKPILNNLSLLLVCILGLSLVMAIMVTIQRIISNRPYVSIFQTSFNIKSNS